MSVRPVADIPQCVACYQMWLPRDTDHWRAYWASDRGGDASADVLLFYCPACAQRRQP